MSVKPGADLPDQQQLTNLVSQALDMAKQHGASAAEAGMSFSSGLNVTVRMDEVETLEYNRDRSLGVTVYLDHKKGSASTSDWRPQAIEDVVQAAIAIAKYAGEDPYSGLADADRMAKEIIDLDLFHPWGLDAEQAIDVAKQCEQAARSHEGITNSEGATVSTRSGFSVYGNSHGFVGAYNGTRHSISASVIADDDNGMQRDYWYTMARDANDMDAADVVGHRAAQRTLKRRNARKLKTMRVPLIFQAEVASSLFRHFISAISGGNLYRQSSFLLDHLGKQIFPDYMQISEQPHLAKAIGSAAYDQEGVQTTSRSIIDKGILQGYVLSSYSARKLGMETTGNAGGVHNLQIQSSDSDFEDLLKQMNTGLIVTELMGQGINIVTGDYSRGAAGYWVENGEIVHPVEEITIAGNLRDMFKNIIQISNDVDLRGNIHTGSVLVENMTIAGD
jgi:PmbA protein